MDEQTDAAGFRVLGRVQGVGYRHWTQRTASALGLRGTERNCPDGSVEVVAFGTPAQLDDLRALLHRGPPGAGVTEVTPFLPPPTTPPKTFDILL